jgi:hypothetical protein
MVTMMKLHLFAIRVELAFGISCSPAYAAAYWPYDGQAPLPSNLD